MLRSLKSKAHMLLLSRFIYPQNQDDVANPDIWRSVLGEHPAQAIKGFVDDDLIKYADLKNTLEYKHKVTELKDMLKKRGLPVSGRKDEMAQRLVTADPNGMKKSIEDLTVVECTQSGRQLAEQYLLGEKEKRSRVEQQIIEYIKKRMFREACLAVAAYEAEQVFSRGLGVDWKHYNPSRDIEVLTIIFNSKPKILSKLGDDKLENLRQGASLMELWGKGTAQEWLLPDLETGLSFDANTAARMFLFYARNKVSLEQYRISGVFKYVVIIAAQDGCDACNKLNKKKYKLNEVQELPYEHCTHEKGCRCVFAPSTK